MNEFQKTFKSVDAQRLIEIIEDAENYQLLAVEAAKLELAKRELTNSEITDIKNDLSERRSNNQKRQEKIKIVEDSAKKLKTELFETLRPVQDKPQTLSRRINLIALVFGFYSIFQVFRDWFLIQFMFSDLLFHFSLVGAMFFLELILLPLGVFLFWKRNKTGWILLTVLFLNEVIRAIILFFITWRWNQQETLMIDPIPGDSIIRYEEITNFLPQPDPIIYIVKAFIFGATLAFMYKQNLRKVFGINEDTAKRTTVVAVILSILIIIGMK